MSVNATATGGSAATPAPDSAGRLHVAMPAVLVVSAAVIVASAAFAVLPFDRALVAAPLAGVLVVLAAIDLERRIIPNRIVLPATGLVLLANVVLFPDHAAEWSLGAIVAALALALPRAVKGSWMGMGDVKLALLLGAGLGWAALSAIVVAALCVFPVAIVIMLRGGAAARHATIPFGPFLSIGGLILVFGMHVAGLPTS